MAPSRYHKLVIGLCAVVLVILVRLFYIQILDDSYKVDAGNNSTRHVPIFPKRGIIYDRNGRTLVGNEICYDLMVTPIDLKEFDTLKLASVLDVSVETIREKMAEYDRNRSRIGGQSVVMFKQMSSRQYTKFAEVSYLFPGFSGQSRTIRQYPYNAGGNLLGYVSEVDADYIKSHPGEYRPGDYAGKTGIEAAREKELRGTKGDRIYLRDSRNRIVTRYENGERDVEAIPGEDIVTTIDAELQNYGQMLMDHKVGSLVAIEPSTGEILALVSSPGIDVDVLSDIGSHYKEISENKYKPLFNRAVQASYPPGSVFKLVNCLIGLQEGVLTPYTQYPCSQGYHFGNNKKLGCHVHKSPLNMEESIMMSCNAYYCYVLRNILENKKYDNISEAMDKWDEYVWSFGFGKKLGSDFPSELGGNIPTSKYYNKVYKRRWNAHTVISLSIGQGEIGVTPLHIANLCATIANRGYYYIPHIIKDSEGIKIDEKYHLKHYTLVDTVHFPKVIKGMYKAVNSGSGSGGTASIAAVEGLDICGKTGTAQVSHGADNSVFICFAPMDNPRIAVAAYVEHGGFGATWAAPIASLLVEKYLTGEVRRTDLEKRIMKGKLIP